MASRRRDISALFHRQKCDGRDYDHTTTNQRRPRLPIPCPAASGVPEVPKVARCEHVQKRSDQTRQPAALGRIEMKRHPSLLCVGWPLGTFLLMHVDWPFKLMGACMIMTALALFLWFPSIPPAKGEAS